MDKEKIVASFGVEFYEKMRGDLEKYAELWGLSDFEAIDNYTWSCTFRCVSDKHGLCVLKISENQIAAELECRVLREYNGWKFCKLYESDEANGVFLVERIMPGTPLSGEPDFDKRMDMYCEFLRDLHIKPADKSNYVSYMTWVNNLTEYMSTREDCKELYIQMVKAQEICRSLYEKYDEVLLHNDLGCGHVLLDSNNGCYRTVDPRESVVGLALFDIVNGMGWVDSKTDLYTTGIISKKLNIPERDLWRAIYVVICREIGKHVKYGGKQEDINQILRVEKLMDEMMQ